MSESTDSLVRISPEQCQTMANLINRIRPPSASEEEMRCDIPDRIMSNTLFTVVAICHQTTSPHDLPLIGTVNGKLRRGWDYLLQKWIKATHENHTLVHPSSLALLRSEDVEEILYDDEYGSRITDPQGRAALLNDIGRQLQTMEVDDVHSIYEVTGGTLVGESGLMKQLIRFKAYGADPVRKKLLFFLALMFNQGYWKYNDPENLGTPVDYHEVRGHLRYGTVEVVCDELQRKIINGLEVTSEEDIAIRKATYEAIMQVSHTSERTPNDLHYFFWNLFRNCCTRDRMHCEDSDGHTNLPERYRLLSPKRCAFSDTCAKRKELKDHVVDTDLY